MHLKPLSELEVMHWEKENVECDLYDVKETIPTKSPDPGRIVSDSFNSLTPIKTNEIIKITCSNKPILSKISQKL